MADTDTAAPQASAGRTGSRPEDPYRDFNFKLEVDGVTEGHFAECSGLSVQVDVIDYREGGNQQVTHKLPGAVHYDGITLRYGLTRSTDLWDWLQTVVQGRTQRRHVSIVMLEPDGQTQAMRWNLLDTWPSHWRGARLDARGSEVAFESLTLQFEGLERA